MKKWFVGLMMLLALVLITSVAMADADEPPFCSRCGECMEKVSVTPYERYHVILWECKPCGNTQKTYPDHTLGAATCVGRICTVCDYRSDDDIDEFNHVTPIITGYDWRGDSATHIVYRYCEACHQDASINEDHTFGGWTPSSDGMQHIGSCVCTATTTRNHTGGNPTCTTPATCTDCDASYYGAHNWSEWQPHMFSPNLHYRYCQNPGCSASESEAHDGNSNCVTSATCSKCHATYKDTTKHVGPLTYTYEKHDESFHKRIETCTACGNETGNKVTTKHEESTPAECTHAAWCNVCNQAYGDPNPDNHRWGNWTYENKNLHYRICAHNESHIQHADHRGYATCIDSMPCLDCGCSYKDPDKHQGGTDFDYTNVSDAAHIVTVICKGCHRKINTYFESHSEQTPATCSSRAICAKCSTPYGDLAPNNHIGEATTTYVKTSETQHTAKITYAGCGHTVDGVSTAHTAATPATCIAAAYCAVCKSSYGSTDPNAHDLVQYDAQAPTCTEIGWNAYEACKNCTYTTYSALDVNPNNHVGTPTTTYVKTSETQHTAKITYSVCKHTVDGESTDHTETTPATCTAAAYCAVCESSYGEADPDAHDLESHDAKEATCTAIGWDAYETCSRCDYTTYVEKSALGHDRVSHDAKAPTCTEIGWDAYDTCSRCDYSTYVEKTALGHDRVSHDAQASTCTAIGWDAYDTCSRCDYTTYAEKPALGHARVSHDAKDPTCTAIGWDAYDTCSRCDYSTYAEKSALGHDAVKHDAQAPTCTAIGWDTYDTCSRCDYSTYAEKSALGHDIVKHDAQAPTCFHVGWNAYEACQREGCGYTTYVEKGTLVHWYGEWTPNADGTHSATCRYGCGYRRTVPCACFTYQLNGDPVAEYTLCPVCGEVNDGTRLTMAEGAKAVALTRTLPGGEVVVRMGVLSGGEAVMSVAFESAGCLTKPTGQVKINLPAELLEGYALRLLAGDGTETELTFDVRKEEASFVLDFSGASSPVRVIRLIPEV